MNCKPGDLAFVLGDDDDPVNIGAVVRVLYAIPINGHIFAPDGEEWEDLDGTPGWIVETEGRLLTVEDDLLRYAGFDDADLLPLPANPELLPAPPQEVAHET